MVSSISVKGCNPERMAPWRRDNLDSRILRAIAAQEPLAANILKAHYAHANWVFAGRVDAYEKEHGKFPDPKPGEYVIAVKRCTDSRHATGSLNLFCEIPVIHENTAGSIVHEGHVFRSLAPGGFGIVEGHFQCGATNVAHLLHSDQFHGERDENILRILTSIPDAVAKPDNPSIRDRRNAVHQAAMAKFTQSDAGKLQSVYPAFLTWEHDIDYQWLKGMPISPIPGMIEAELRKSFEYALAEGREITPQYATMALMYDPYRLGRFNDPRVIMDALMNEFFCITFDFRRMVNGDKRPLSRIAMGSLMYANFHDGHGHVNGVGGKDGTRMIGVLDPDEKVLEHVKAELLQNPQIKEMTRNGKTILLIKYNLATRLIEFLG